MRRVMFEVMREDGLDGELFESLPEAKVTAQSLGEGPAGEGQRIRERSCDVFEVSWPTSSWSPPKPDPVFGNEVIHYGRIVRQMMADPKAGDFDSIDVEPHWWWSGDPVQEWTSE